MITVKDLKDIADCPIKYIDKVVKVYGWIETIRDQKKLIFLNLRNNYRYLQLCGTIKIENLTRESYVSAIGIFTHRTAKQYNYDNELGMYEIKLQSIEVLSRSDEIDFGIHSISDLSNEVKYSRRYITLRSKTEIANLIFRADVKQYIRNWFRDRDYLEIDTPLFISSSPEGARNFLVLSSKNPGTAYALPQSPQIYKQLLIVGGINRYYQFAPTFRDEDTRSDRLAGEFYQIDVEIASIESRSEVIEIIDNFVQCLLNKFCTTKTIMRKTITYEESMQSFRSDKPDLRLINIHSICIENNKFVLHAMNEDSRSKLILYKKHLDELKIENNIIDMMLSVEYSSEIYRILCGITDRIYPDIISICYVIDFPLFADNSKELTHNPFSAFDETTRLSMQYDLVMNGVEIASGSLRNTDATKLQKIFRDAGYSDEDIRDHFGAIVDAYRFGAPTHGGFAIGFERLLTILRSNDIKSYVAFPLSQTGKDFLFNSPRKLDNQTLSVYNLKLR